MIIKTKFNINDVVYCVQQNSKVSFVTCGGCEGEGRLILKNGESLLCPKCYGRKGENTYGERIYTIGRKLTIGQVRTEITNFSKDTVFDNIGGYAGLEMDVQENIYMAYETGIKSGNLWSEENLFKNEKLAQEYCDKKNSCV